MAVSKRFQAVSRFGSGSPETAAGVEGMPDAEIAPIADALVRRLDGGIDVDVGEHRRTVSAPQEIDGEVLELEGAGDPLDLIDLAIGQRERVLEPDAVLQACVPLIRDENLARPDLAEQVMRPVARERPVGARRVDEFEGRHPVTRAGIDVEDLVAALLSHRLVDDPGLAEIAFA